MKQLKLYFPSLPPLPQCPQGNQEFIMVQQLLQQDPSKRLNTLEDLKEDKVMASIDWEAVERREVQPTFVPPVSKLVVTCLSLYSPYAPSSSDPLSLTIIYLYTCLFTVHTKWVIVFSTSRDKH